MKTFAALFLVSLFFIVNSCGPNFYFVVKSKEEFEKEKREAKYKETPQKAPSWVYIPNAHSTCRVKHIGYYYDYLKWKYIPFRYSCGEVKFDYPNVITSHQYNQMNQHRRSKEFSPRSTSLGSSQRNQPFCKASEH